MTKSDLTKFLLLALGVFSVAFLYGGNTGNGFFGFFLKKTEKTVDQPVPDSYGMDLNKFNFCGEDIKRGQNLFSLLSSYNFGEKTLSQISKNTNPIFNLKYLKPKHEYRLYFEDDCSEQPSFFHYRISKDRFLKIDLKNLGKGSVEAVPYLLKRKEGSFIVSRNIRESLKKSGLPKELENMLNEIFGWTVNLKSIQSGDFVKIIWEEKQIEGKKVGLEKILAVEMGIKDSTYYAFSHKRGNLVDYFDQNGKCLTRTFLSSPVTNATITSGFSFFRKHPILGTVTTHPGIDFAAPEGTPIYAVGDGKVEFAQYWGGNGNFVKIKHNDLYSTQYLHMKSFARGIKPGKRVQKGEIIGYVGSTGLSTGPHVCFRFWKNGVQINPEKMKTHGSNPLNVLEMNGFCNFVPKMLNELRRVDIGLEGGTSGIAMAN